MWSWGYKSGDTERIVLNIKKKEIEKLSIRIFINPDNTAVTYAERF